MSMFQRFLQSIFSRRNRRPAPNPRRIKHRFVPYFEELEPRVVPAWNMTLSDATTAGVSVAIVGPTETFTATATGANLNWYDVGNALIAGANVVINSGSTGTEAGNITDQTGIATGANANFGTSLTFQSGTGTGLVGNINLDGFTFGSGSTISIVIDAAGSVTEANLLATSNGSVYGPLPSVLITAGGTVNTVSLGSIYATNLAIQAKGAIGSSGTPLSTHVSNLVAKVTGTTGGIYIDNTGSLTIGYSGDPFKGVTTNGSGAIDITNAGSVNITNSFPEHVWTGAVGGGAISITANGINSDITTGGGQSLAISSPAAITLNAGRDIILGTAGQYGGITGGSVYLGAGRNITVDEGTDVQGYGGITATAAGNLSLLATTKAGAEFDAINGSLILTTGAGGTFTLNSGTNGKLHSGGGNITVSADSMVINDPIKADSGGNVTLEQASTTTRAIVLGGTTAGNLAISNAALAEITANVVRIGRTDNAGSITVTANTPVTAFSTLHLLSGGAVSESAIIYIPDLAIDAASASLMSSNGVNTLAANLTTGGLNFRDQSGLTIGSVDGDTGVTAKGSVVLTGTGGNVTLAADVTSKSSTVDLNVPLSTGNIFLAGNRTVSAGTSGNLKNVNFNGGGVSGGGHNLTVAGNALFEYPVQAVGNLSVSGTTSINGTVGTSGTQTYTGAVTLNVNTTLSSTGSGTKGNINFKSTVDSASTTLFSLTVNTAGTTIFGGQAGGSHSLKSLTTDAPGSTQINGGTVHTTGGQTYNDNVTLGGNTMLTAGNVNFAGNLTLGSSSAAAIDKLTVNGNFKLASSGTLTSRVNGASPGSFGNVSTTGTATITGSILAATGGPGLTGGNLALINSSPNSIIGTFSGQPEGSTVTLNGIPFTISYKNDLVTLDAQPPTTAYVDQTFLGTTPGNNPATHPTGLTLQFGYNAFADIQSGLNALASGGTIVVFADSGAYTANFTVSNPTTFDFNQNPQNGSSSTVVNIGGTATLDSNVTFTQAAYPIPGNPSLAAADLTFYTSGNIFTGGTPVSLTVNGNSNGDDFDGTIGTATNPLSSVSVTSALIALSDVTTNTTQIYNGPVSVLSSGSGTVTLTGSTITFGGTLQTNPFTFGNLTIAGNTIFDGSVASINNLQVNGTTAINTSSIETSGGQTYTGPVTLGASTVLTSTSKGNIFFGSTIQSPSSPFSLTINTAGTTTFTGAVGGGSVFDLGSLQVTGTTAINTTSIETSGGQTYTGAVTLGASSILTSTSGGNISFGSTVQSPTSPFGLTVNTAGTTLFTGAVGTNTKPLGALTTNSAGSTQINGGSVNTSGFDQTYNDNVTLGQTYTLLAGIVNFNADLVLGSTATTATSKLQIAGTLNFASTTTVTTTFAGTSLSQIGHILVGGGNTTYGNATLVVNYSSFTPVPGNSFDVVSNGGFGIGQFVNAPAPGIFSFAGVKYAAVYNGSAGGGDFIMTALSANESYIEALYQAFLGRPGAQPEWDYWAAALPSLARAGVINGIELSTEGLNRLVNQLYLRFLNRPATGDPGEQYWVNLLAGSATEQRASEEQVSAGILAGSEFASRADALIGTTDSNSNFVQALYQLLLNRPGDTAGLNYWLNALNTGAFARGAVALDFLTFAEYRTGAVSTFYGNTSLPVFPYQPFFPNFLNRTPAASDVNYWVGSPLALLDIEQSFGASDEFYSDNS